MKKIILILLVFLLVGCSSNEGNKTMDLSNLKKELTELKIEDKVVFGNIANINDLDVIESYGMDVSLFSDYLIYISTEVEDPSMFMVVSPKEGEEAVVDYQIDDFFSVYHAAYNGYYPEVAYMIENRKEEKVGNYLVYVISKDSDKVYDVIKKNYK